MSRIAEITVAGNAVRAERARLRKEARERPEILTALLLDPPPAVADMTLVDLLRLPTGGRRSTAALTMLGQRAARDRINLLLPVGYPASRRAREWCAAHAQWRRAAQGGVTLAARSTP